jgi:hypothetical protein
LCSLYPQNSRPYIQQITKWANDTSPESQSVYWLFGQAGSGKSTIAYTIAHRFEFGHDCFRRQLLLLTPIRGDEISNPCHLYHCISLNSQMQSIRGCLEKVRHRPSQRPCSPLGSKASLSNLGRRLDSPIHQSQPVSSWPSTPLMDRVFRSFCTTYLISLTNIACLVSSSSLRVGRTQISSPVLRILRADSSIVLKKFRSTKCRLTSNVNLPDFISKDMDELVTLAAGLFVYAATVVKYMGGHTRQEQKPLKKLLPSTSKSTTSQTPPVATDLLDELYIQILLHIFHRFTEDILYTDAVSFTPSSVPQSVTQRSLLSGDSDSDTELVVETHPAVSIADDVLRRLTLCSISKTTKSFGTTNHSLTSCLIKICRKTFGATKRNIINSSPNPASASWKRGCDSTSRTSHLRSSSTATIPHFRMQSTRLFGQIGAGVGFINGRDTEGAGGPH